VKVIVACVGPKVFNNNNNNNIHICIAPYGRNFRGAKLCNFEKFSGKLIRSDTDVMCGL